MHLAYLRRFSICSAVFGGSGLSSGGGAVSNDMQAFSAATSPGSVFGSLAEARNPPKSTVPRASGSGRLYPRLRMHATHLRWASTYCATAMADALGAAGDWLCAVATLGVLPDVAQPAA